MYSQLYNNKKWPTHERSEFETSKSINTKEVSELDFG